MKGIGSTCPRPGAVTAGAAPWERHMVELHAAGHLEQRAGHVRGAAHAPCAVAQRCAALLRGGHQFGHRAIRQFGRATQTMLSVANSASGSGKSRLAS